MVQVIDIKKEYIAAKAKEKIIGFAGFRLSMSGASNPLEGNLLLSSHKRSDGSGYLSLTFIIDSEVPTTSSATVSALFARVRRNDSFADLGRQFESMIDTSIPLDRSDNWFMESFTFYSDLLSNINKHHIEEMLLPTFEKILPIRFDPVEWLPEEATVKVPLGSPSTFRQEGSSFLQSLKKWLGASD